MVAVKPSEPLMRPLRFGIVCSHAGLATWQAAAVRHLIESGDAEPALLIVKQQIDHPERHHDSPLWRLFTRLDQPASMDTAGAVNQLQGVQTLEDADEAAIRAHDLDFILKFEPGALSADVVQSCRYGIWSFRFGKHMDESPLCFWEIHDGDVITSVALRCTTGPHAERVLRQGYLKTLDYSYSRNCDFIALEAAHWPAYVAAAIRWGCDTTVAPEPSPAFPARRDISSFATTRFIGRVAYNIVRRVLRRCVREEWDIGVVPLPVQSIAIGAPIRQATWFATPRDGWLADPIARSVNGKIDVLCERMEFRPDRAYIAAASFDGKAWSKDLPAIQLDFHVSYPYLVEEDGQIYCVPETCEASELRVYRAVEFPTTWEAAGVLLPGFPAVDSTIFRFDGRWWLFATSREASDHKLYAWHADALRGPWQPHRANPIKIDVRGSRSAGAPFWVDGALYRPAQDCSTTYGGRISLHRIRALTPAFFYETLERFVEPDPTSPYKRGLHTLSAAGASTVIDGRCYRLRWFGKNPAFD